MPVNTEIPGGPAVRQWRITVKTDVGAKVRHQEPFAGNEHDARRRAAIMWARTSYLVNTSNREVYASLEVWDERNHQYRMVKEKKGTYPGKLPPAEM
jgi:hypothetical protein